MILDATGLQAVVHLAKRLEVLGISQQPHVTTSRDDVVYLFSEDDLA